MFNPIVCFRRAFFWGLPCLCWMWFVPAAAVPGSPPSEREMGSLSASSTHPTKTPDEDSPLPTLRMTQDVRVFAQNDARPAKTKEFRLPAADPVGSETTSGRQISKRPRESSSNSDSAQCGTSEEQLGLCCAAAGVSGVMGADACRRGDMTTALLAGGVFSILASGAIGGFVGWQYAQTVGMEDPMLATQIGAGVGIVSSLVTVGGAMLLLGGGSACMQGCLGCGGHENPEKVPAKSRPRGKRRKPRGRTL